MVKHTKFGRFLGHCIQTDIIPQTTFLRTRVSSKRICMHKSGIDLFYPFYNSGINYIHIFGNEVINSVNWGARGVSDYITSPIQIQYGNASTIKLIFPPYFVGSYSLLKVWPCAKNSFYLLDFYVVIMLSASLWCFVKYLFFIVIFFV